jgi:hypothetical protein
VGLSDTILNGTHPGNISHFNLLLRNHWANCNQPLVEWSLDGPLPKMCPVILTSNQDGHQATKNQGKSSDGFRNMDFQCQDWVAQTSIKFKSPLKLN